MRHTIEHVSFRDGRLQCACGAVCTNRDATPYHGGGHSTNYLAPAGTPDALAGAWQQHRRDVGAGVPVRNLGTGDSPAFVARLA